MSVLIIAEIGSVHDGKIELAKELIDSAAASGADIVKFQTHIAEAETLKDAPNPSYFSDEPRFDYFKRTGYSLDEWKEIAAYCEKAGVEFLSSPFSNEAVDLLELVGVKRHKVPSGEVSNIPLLEKLASTGKPVLLSSGMSSWEEIDTAVDILKSGGELTVMQCTSEYPCPYEEVGLNVMQEMREKYGTKVGFSDHTLTNFAVFAAVALGADVIEVHFTLSRDMYGSDAKHSMEPNAFGEMVEGIRAIETMLSTKVDKTADRYRDMKDIFEKSIVSVADIASGETITEEQLAVKKPGTGIPAAELSEIVGRTAARDISADSLLSEDDLA